MSDSISVAGSGHGGDGPGVNYGVPDRYQGPSVSDQPELINPSAGESSPAGGGVNPQGAAPSQSANPGVNTRQAPGDTSVG